MNTLIYKLARWFLHTIGRTSSGLSLCLAEGLTSGKTVDYVYRHQAQGRFLIGKLIDKQFLNHPGWEGVRQRRRNAEDLIAEAILELRAQKKPIVLVDIASGPAAYILSVLKKVGEHDVTARCQDLEERWLQEGTYAAQTMDLKNVHFQQGDAFDAESLIKLHPQPNIFVASGFYDWIFDDVLVQRSFSTLYQTLHQGGYFVVTNQVSHPNLKFVQHMFSDFNHQPLNMKMRSAELIQQWLKDAGFHVKKSVQDARGYYSVTLAVKE